MAKSNTKPGDTEAAADEGGQTTITISPLQRGFLVDERGRAPLVVIHSNYGGGDEKEGTLTVRVNHTYAPFKRIQGEKAKDLEARQRTYEAALVNRENSLLAEVNSRLKELGAPEYSITAEHMKLLR